MSAHNHKCKLCPRTPLMQLKLVIIYEWTRKLHTLSVRPQSQNSQSESSNKSRYSICASSQPSVDSNNAARSSSPITMGVGSDGAGGLVSSTAGGMLGVFFALRFRRLVTLTIPLFLLRRPSSSLSRSSFQNPPFPGSSLERGTLTKHLLRDRLCRIEFCNNNVGMAFP